MRPRLIQTLTRDRQRVNLNVRAPKKAMSYDYPIAGDVAGAACARGRARPFANERERLMDVCIPGHRDSIVASVRGGSGASQDNATALSSCIGTPRVRDSARRRYLARTCDSTAMGEAFFHPGVNRNALPTMPNPKSPETVGPQACEYISESQIGRAGECEHPACRPLGARIHFRIPNRYSGRM